jgi:hypothetical protein
MAKQRNTVTQSGAGGNQSGGIGRIPENRSDDIIMGATLPMRFAPVPNPADIRRAFKEPTRAPLHYYDGPGPDEVVTARKIPPAPLLDGHKWAADNFELRPDAGPDNAHYSGDGASTTSNGVEIRGT